MKKFSMLASTAVLSVSGLIIGCDRDDVATNDSSRTTVTSPNMRDADRATDTTNRVADTTGNAVDRTGAAIGDAAIGGAISHVLGKFTSEEMRLLPEIFKITEQAIAVMQESGISKAMSLYNGVSVSNV